MVILQVKTFCFCHFDGEFGFRKPLIRALPNLWNHRDKVARINDSSKNTAGAELPSAGPRMFRAVETEKEVQGDRSGQGWSGSSNKYGATLSVCAAS